MNYCPETVLVHSAFVLADKESGKNLNRVEKGECSRAVQLVSETIREVINEAPQADTRKLLQVEVRELEFKIHSWVFASLLKGYIGFDVGESPEEDYFHSFPPLPQFGVSFYLELVHDLGWGELLVEGLCAVGVENVTLLLEDIIKCLAQEPSVKDLSLFHCLFNSLLMIGKQTSPSDNQDTKLENTLTEKSCPLLLLQGVASLIKDYTCWSEAQIDIIKGIIDFTIEGVVELNFRKHTGSENKDILPGNCCLQNSLPHKSHLCPVDEGRVTEGTANVNSEHDDDMEVNEMETTKNYFSKDLVVSADIMASIELLCRVITNDWRVTSHWIQTDTCMSSIDEVDCQSWHPLHKWIVKLYAVSYWLVCHFQPKSMLMEQASRLQNGLAHYVKTYCTKTELAWIDGFSRGELIDLGENYGEEKFNPPTESVDLLLFQPETTDEQFHFYLQRVTGRLEGYKECFDWLLSAEEFHSESDWLECMRNHAVQISDVQHAVKMTDIVYVQRQLLCSEEASADVTYRDMKQVLLNLYSTFPCSAQEQIIEYAFYMSLTLECPEEDSIFFHPSFIAQESTAFQQELVMIFNKLIDISSESELQSVMKDLARAALVSPQMTLNKAVQEGVKSAGHSKSICSVLEKLPVVCMLRCNESACSRTLLCKAVESLTVSISSRQQENNLLNLVAVLLSSGSSDSSPLLSVQEFIEAIVLPSLNNANVQGDIPTVRALKLLNNSLAAVKTSVSPKLHFLKKHLIPIILCLCELLDECNVFWDGLAPVHSLSEVEELRELVLQALSIEIKLCGDVLERSPSFARAIEWLVKRLRSGFDWTVPLHLKQLFSAAYIKYKFPVPPCLLTVCEDSGDEWATDEDLARGSEDVFTVLFEYCRVSESALQRILESLIPNKLTNSFQDIRSKLVSSLTQVINSHLKNSKLTNSLILPHCTRREWKRVLELCRHLLSTNIMKVGVAESPGLQANGSSQDVYQLSALLLDVMKVLHGPLCSLWATPHVWLYVTRHYITAVKQMVDQTTDSAVTSPVFAHVCHVMTFVPADCKDQLFVLALDLVTRPLVSNDDVSEQLRLSINSLSSEVYKAALLQKLYQNL